MNKDTELEPYTQESYTTTNKTTDETNDIYLTREPLKWKKSNKIMRKETTHELQQYLSN